MVRRRKLTDQRTEALLQGLRMGMTRQAAAGAVGIHPTTLWRMVDADAAFRTAVETAEAEAEARYTAIVAQATQDPKHWTAAAWWLERRRYRDYARREKVEMSIDLRTIAARIAEESDLDADAIMAEAERVLAGDR